jgi:hypothetical protein
MGSGMVACPCCTPDASTRQFLRSGLLTGDLIDGARGRFAGTGDGAVSTARLDERTRDVMRVGCRRTSPNTSGVHRHDG